MIKRRIAGRSVTVTSRVNGLKVAVPADAAGVVPRFGSKGGNELVFDQSKLTKKLSDNEPMIVKSEAPDKPEEALA